MNAATDTSTTGRTKDAGWEVGVRKTIPVDLDDVWDFLLEDGLAIWLGELEAPLVLEKGAAYATVDGTSGRVLSYTPALRLRLSWRPVDWDHDSTLQLTVREASTGTTIGFHQERLSGRDERKQMLGRWKDVTARLEQTLAAGPIAAEMPNSES